MKTSLGLAVLALGAASLLSAQEYKIQMHRPEKAGQEFELSFQYQETHKVSASFLGRTAPEQKTNFVAELSARVKVLESDSSGRITKASCVISNCVRVEGRYKHEMLAPEAVVTASASDGQAEFLVKGRPVEPEVQKLLLIALELNASGKTPTPDETFGTATPKKIGESWAIQPEPLAAMLRTQKLNIDKTEIEGKTTLERLVKVGEVDCLELASKVYLKNLRVPLPPGVRTTFAFGALRLSGKYPLDTSVGALEEAMDLTMDFTVQARAGTNTLGVTSKMSSVVKRNVQRRYLQ